MIYFNESDLAGDVDDRKSTSGISFFLKRSLVTWTSHKQKIVALSSCEAEYVAATKKYKKLSREVDRLFDHGALPKESSEYEHEADLDVVLLKMKRLRKYMIAMRKEIESREVHHKRFIEEGKWS